MKKLLALSLILTGCSAVQTTIESGKSITGAIVDDVVSIRTFLTWMEELYKLGKIPEEIYSKYVFYRKAFWICFAYVLWDTLHAFGWL